MMTTLAPVLLLDLEVAWASVCFPFPELESSEKAEKKEKKMEIERTA